MRVVGVDRRILEVTGRILVAVFADVLEQLVIAGTPVEPVGLLELLSRTVLAAGLAAARIVDQTIGGEAVIARGRLEHAEPVDQYADALLEDVGVETCVAGRGFVPDLTPCTL